LFAFERLRSGGVLGVTAVGVDLLDSGHGGFLS
jgi:hypothetical protein